MPYRYPSLSSGARQRYLVLGRRRSAVRPDEELVGEELEARAGVENSGKLDSGDPLISLNNERAPGSERGLDLRDRRPAADERVEFDIVERREVAARIRQAAGSAHVLGCRQKGFAVNDP